jgi:hypothetical protein
MGKLKQVARANQKTMNTKGSNRNTLCTLRVAKDRDRKEDSGNAELSV